MSWRSIIEDDDFDADEMLEKTLASIFYIVIFLIVWGVVAFIVRNFSSLPFGISFFTTCVLFYGWKVYMIDEEGA